MERQKKTNSGITLVALVVSIIVMLVLAGVSLNATVGENGIVTRAQEAALKQKTAEDLENLNLELAKLNIDTISADEAMTIQDIANYLLSKNVIDNVVKKSSGQIAAGIDATTGNRYFFGIKGDNTYKITRENDGLLSAELSSNASGGNIDGGYALVTLDSFNTGNDVPESDKGKFIITSDAEVVFMDSISGELSIYVKAGVHAIVGIYADILLTNENVIPKRSAIEIEPTGSLDIYIGEKAENVPATLTVNSGFGEDGEEGNENGAKGGPGGYAGIHVPEGATLNLHGIGTVVAYGGNAGNGVDSSNVYGGGGGGGAGAGIGGNGGKGGDANKTQTDGRGHNLEFNSDNPVDGSDPQYNTNSGWNGGNGENGGVVNIYDDVVVYAYGGGGGHAGNGVESSGSGSGGYPGAGIGGGGAGGGGGSHAGAAGGYTGGSPQGVSYIAQNGLACPINTSSSGGSGYFEVGGGNLLDLEHGTDCVGGIGGVCWWGTSWYKDLSGYGGIGGKGCTVSYTNQENIFAYNGNLVTDQLEETGVYPDYLLTRNADGVTTITEKIEDSSLDKLTRLDNKVIIPLKIFAQSGTIRETYTTNQSNFTLARITRTLATGETLPSVATDYDKVVLIRATDRIINPTTGYSNGYCLNQGIGSGAGYLESSNGSFESIN